MVSRQYSESLSSVDGAESSWLDVLPSKKLFSIFRERSSGDTAEGGNVMCMIRENLFVWSDHYSCSPQILTLNLKQLASFPMRDTYQVLDLSSGWDSSIPYERLVKMIPDESGNYIAINCERRLAVIKLHYYRGDNGEFSGGGEVVRCRATMIAHDIFAINDKLTLLQVSWFTPAGSHTLALLTSDNFIRLFNLIDPNLPLLEVPLFPSSPNIQLRSGGVSLAQESAMAFSLWNTSAFVLQDNGDLSLVSLAHHPPYSPPQPLRMFPPDDDNYQCTSPLSLLLLKTTPLTVVVADSTGMIYHCVYLAEKNSDDQDDDGDRPFGSQKLYVVERIRIEVQTLDTAKLGDTDRASPFILLHDPASLYGYFVIHPEGVHKIHMPWMEKIATFTSSNLSSLSSKAECQMTYLIATEPNFTSLQGLTVVWEPLLGYALIGLTSRTWECLTLPLDEPKKIPDFDFRRSIDEVDWTPQIRSPWRNSGFAKIIEATLHSPGNGEDSSFALRSHRGACDTVGNQACYRFLMSSIKQLKRRYIIKQHEALKKTERRVYKLRQEKEKLISNIVQLRDERDIVEEESEKLQERIEFVLKRNKILRMRAERLACQVASRSLVFSEAEESMKEELGKLQKRMTEMNKRLETGGGKLKLYQNIDTPPEVDLNASQSNTLMMKLVDNSEKVKMLSSIVKTLSDIMPT